MGTRTNERGIDFGTGANQVNSKSIPSGFSPTTYSPSQVAAEGTDKISAHLKGIDDFLAGVGGGSGKTVTPVITSAYSPLNNQIVRADSTGAPFTLTLPATPTDKDEIELVDVGGALATNPVLINRNGNNINGVADDVSWDVNYSRVLLIFSTGKGWSLN